MYFGCLRQTAEIQCVQYSSQRLWRSYSTVAGCVFGDTYCTIRYCSRALPYSHSACTALLYCPLLASERNKEILYSTYKTTTTVHGNIATVLYSITQEKSSNKRERVVEAELHQPHKLPKNMSTPPHFLLKVGFNHHSTTLPPPAAILQNYHTGTVVW